MPDLRRLEGVPGPMKKPCPICGYELRPQSFGKHVDACSRLPSNTKIESLLASGWGVKRIAREYGVSHSTCFSLLRYRGIDIQKNSVVNQWGYRECPHCGRRLRKQDYKRHVAWCRHAPSRDEILDHLHAGGTLVQIARERGISSGTLAIYASDLGINVREIRFGPRVDLDRELPDLSHLAPPDDVICPEYGTWGQCDSCKHEDQCRRRSAAGLWVLCERPTREHVALAFINGDFGSDGYMPEWLQESIKELGYERDRC